MSEGVREPTLSVHSGERGPLEQAHPIESYEIDNMNGRLYEYKGAMKRGHEHSTWSCDDRPILSIVGEGDP